MLRNLAMTMSLALSCLVVSAPADAAVFKFSFENDLGDIDGRVAGKIVLPDGDGDWAAERVKIKSSPDLMIPFDTPYDVLELAIAVEANAFSVNGGEIVDHEFAVLFGGPCTAFVMAGPAEFSLLNKFEVCDLTSGVLDANSQSLRFEAVQGVPLPATAPLALVALAGLGMLARRRRAA